MDLVDEFRKWERSHNRENYGRYDAFKAGATFQAHHDGDIIDWARRNLDSLECRGDEDCDHCDLLGLLHDYDLREKSNDSHSTARARSE